MATPEVEFLGLETPSIALSVRLLWLEISLGIPPLPLAVIQSELELADIELEVIGAELEVATCVLEAGSEEDMAEGIDESLPVALSIPDILEV